MGEISQTRDVFDAIADSTRRQLIHLLADAVEIPLHELTAQFPMGRTAAFKHLTILKEAVLVHDRKVGRETRYRLNAAPLREIQDWVAFYNKFWSTNMIRLNQLLEEEEVPNDFKPVVGHRFQFRNQPNEYWEAHSYLDAAGSGRREGEPPSRTNRILQCTWTRRR